MALKNKFMVKANLGTTDFTLKADEGESFLIKDVLFDDTDSQFAELLVDRMSILAIRTCYSHQNQNWNHLAGAYRPGIIKILQDAGLWKGIPVASGQTLTVKIDYPSNKRVFVFYEIHDQGDMTPDMENGTESNEYLFINYGSNAVAIANAAYGDLDKPILPSEYLNFPFGDVVPSRHEVDLIAVMTSRFDRLMTATLGLPWTKLIRGREVLFDPDREGIYTGSGQSLWGWGGRMLDDQQPISLLPKPITFKAGEDLTIQQYNDSGGELAIDALILGVILKVRKLAA